MARYRKSFYIRELICFRLSFIDNILRGKMNDKVIWHKSEWLTAKHTNQTFGNLRFIEQTNSNATIVK